MRQSAMLVLQYIIAVRKVSRHTTSPFWDCSWSSVSFSAGFASEPFAALLPGYCSRPSRRRRRRKKRVGESSRAHRRIVDSRFKIRRTGDGL